MQRSFLLDQNQEKKKEKQNTRGCDVTNLKHKIVAI